MKEIKNKKILNGIIGFMLFLAILIGGFWLINNVFTKDVKAQTNEELIYSNSNLVEIDLEDKEDQGDGTYQIYNTGNFLALYNVYTGYFTYNGPVPGAGNVNIDIDFASLSTKTLQYIYISGSKTGNTGINFGSAQPRINTTNLTSTSEAVNTMRMWAETNSTYNMFTFKVQVEQGDVATNYKVPLQPYLWHEKQLGFNEGFDVGFYYGADYGGESGYQYGYDVGYDKGYDKGYNDGKDDGYDEGYEYGRDEYGYENENGAWITADIWGNIEYDRGYYYGDIEGYDNGYEVARDEYGEYFQSGSPSGMSGWYSFQDGYDLGLDDGWDDGYEYGLIDSPNNNFGNMISTILLGVGTVLGIELLPNITIGAIIAVPIVFGIIAFVLGRKKE